MLFERPLMSSGAESLAIWPRHPRAIHRFRSLTTTVCSAALCERSYRRTVPRHSEAYSLKHLRVKRSR